MSPPSIYSQIYRGSYSYSRWRWRYNKFISQFYATLRQYVQSACGKIKIIWFRRMLHVLNVMQRVCGRLFDLEATIISATVNESLYGNTVWKRKNLTIQTMISYSLSPNPTGRGNFDSKLKSIRRRDFSTRGEQLCVKNTKRFAHLPGAYNVSVNDQFFISTSFWIFLQYFRNISRYVQMFVCCLKICRALKSGIVSYVIIWFSSKPFIRLFFFETSSANFVICISPQTSIRIIHKPISYLDGASIFYLSFAPNPFYR